MLNKYPLWKYLLVLFVVLVGLYYAAPNLYAPDPALQITGESSAQVIDERCAVGNLFFFYAQLLDYDLLDPFCDTAHKTKTSNNGTPPARCAG